jgi:two-component system, OmpR family, KDP operon response regulator KdpE
MVMELVRSVTGARVLVIDDDPGILRIVKRHLSASGYNVTVLDNGVSAVGLVRKFEPDVVLLDLVLPDIDGAELCRAIRSESDTQIVVLSALGDADTKVRLLDEGADDYLTKPFSTKELEARIRVALRHASHQAEPVIVAGPLRLDVGAHRVSLHDSLLHLTPNEFRLLRILMENQERVVTSRLLISQLSGEDAGSHGLRTFIYQLRDKLAGDASLIVNEPGVGYRLHIPQ